MSRNESAEAAASAFSFPPPPAPELPKKKSSAADAAAVDDDDADEEEEELEVAFPWLDAATSLEAATSGPRSRLAARRASHSRRGEKREEAGAEAALLLSPLLLTLSSAAAAAPSSAAAAAGGGWSSSPSVALGEGIILSKAFSQTRRKKPLSLSLSFKKEKEGTRGEKTWKEMNGRERERERERRRAVSPFYFFTLSSSFIFLNLNFAQTKKTMPPPKPLASQADFDEAVSTNVEDFDMSRAEAVVAALEELKLQVRKKGRARRWGASIKKTSSTPTMMFSSCPFISHDPRPTAIHETFKQGKDVSNIITAGEEEVAR